MQFVYYLKKKKNNNHSLIKFGSLFTLSTNPSKAFFNISIDNSGPAERVLKWGLGLPAPKAE